MARPRKTKAAHKRDGSARKDREAKTVEHLFAGGEPTKPKGITAQQECVWNIIVRRVPQEYLGELDTISLTMLVDAFSDWMRFREIVENTCPTAKGFWTLYCAKQAAAKTLDRLLGKFGASPRDRTMIKEITTGGETQGFDFSKMFENNN